MITDFITVTELAFVVLFVIPAIIGLINLLKKVGLPTQFAGVVAVVLGVAVMLLYAAFGDSRYFVLGMVGVLVGLGATGYYDLSKLFGGQAAAPPVVTVNEAPVVDFNYAADGAPTEHEEDPDVLADLDAEASQLGKVSPERTRED